MSKRSSTQPLIGLLVNIVAKGGNFLLNVGPDADGERPEPALERMRQIGQWLRVNGEAIYGTRPIPPYKIGPVCLTRKDEMLYAICPAREGEQPARLEQLYLAPVRAAKAVRMLGSDVALEWEVSEDGLSIRVPDEVWQSPPCEHAWAFKIEGARTE